MMMKSVCPDVRIIFSLAWIITVLAYGYAGSLLFLVFSCLFAIVAIFSFACPFFRRLLQKLFNFVHAYFMMTVTWLLLGTVYFTVFVAFRCVLSLWGKVLGQKSGNIDSSWISVTERIHSKEFKRQF